MDNLRRAYRHCARGSGAPGIDGVTFKDYRQHLSGNLQQLSNCLRNDLYVPMESKGTVIVKKNGKRTVYIPVVEDRIVQRAVFQVAEPLFEQIDSWNRCYLCPCPEKCRIVIRNMILRHEIQKDIWVIDIDIDAFYESVDRSILFGYLAEVIADGKLLNLIYRCLGPQKEGLPIGNVLSLLMSGLYLHRTETIMKHNAITMLRCCDHILILATSPSDATHFLSLLEDILASQGLQLNQEKTKIVKNPNPIDLLRIVSY